MALSIVPPHEQPTAMAHSAQDTIPFADPVNGGPSRTPDNPYRGLILKSRFSWALARMKISIFSQFWPGLDQAIQIGPIFAWMAHQASKGWIFAWTMASGLKILIFPPACSGLCGGLPGLSDAFGTALWGLDVSLWMAYAVSVAPCSMLVVRTCTTACVSLFRAGCTKPNVNHKEPFHPAPRVIAVDNLPNVLCLTHHGQGLWVVQHIPDCRPIPKCLQYLYPQLHDL